MILTADDYGLNPLVNTAIVDLVKKNRLSAVSCMTTTPCAEKALQDLRDLQSDLQVGLHFCLTEGRPFRSFSQSFTAAIKNQIDANLIEAELRNQIDTFLKYFGRLPDYLDGHHHVQQLPGIREVVVRVVNDYSSIRYVRAADLPLERLFIQASKFPSIALNNLPIIWLGRRFRQQLQQQGIAVNRYLLGYYNHHSKIEFSRVFRFYGSFKPQVEDIFFCHPGWDTAVRQDNFKFIASTQFTEELEVLGLTLSRKGDLLFGKGRPPG